MKFSPGKFLKSFSLREIKVRSLMMAVAAIIASATLIFLNFLMPMVLLTISLLNGKMERLFMSFVAFISEAASENGKPKISILVMTEILASWF